MSERPIPFDGPEWEGWEVPRQLPITMAFRRLANGSGISVAEPPASLRAGMGITINDRDGDIVAFDAGCIPIGECARRANQIAEALGGWAK